MKNDAPWILTCRFLSMCCLLHMSTNNVLLRYLKEEMTENPFCSHKNDGSQNPFCIIPSLFFACGYSCANTMQCLSGEVCKILAPAIAFRLRLLFDRFSKQYCARHICVSLEGGFQLTSQRKYFQKEKVDFAKSQIRSE